MPRRAALACLVALAGCQGYNFNPVGKCVIQPGSTRIKVDNVSTADLLFVVDDSGSMASNQANLAQNFSVFIDELATTQKDRATRGLTPLDFHVAITTSAVYENLPAQGGPVCTSAVCTFNTFIDNSQQTYACAIPSSPCGDLITRYWGFTASSHQGCAPGVGAEGRPYPAGDFVAAGGNPRVLHFTKDLDWASWGTASPDPRLTDLVAKFQANINVGTCGSGQEQHLEAARLALQKALRQGGRTQPPDVVPGEFPHDGAKLVVVYVGDEDDCSGPADPDKAVISNTSLDTQDSCVQDWRQADPSKRKEFPPSDYASHLLGLGKPIGAAFIFSSSCTVDGSGRSVCQPALCGCTTAGNASTCKGKSTGTRMKELSTALQSGGADVLESSVCDASFATTLKGIAQLVKPPSSLKLPTQPAASEVTVLRILGANGSSRQCSGPGATADWWFVDCNDATLTPTAFATTCIAIRPGSSCEANPGESYSAEYLGLVPTGGCGTAATESTECAGLLGGRAQDWACEIAQGQSRGTCLCTGTR